MPFFSFKVILSFITRSFIHLVSLFLLLPLASFLLLQFTHHINLAQILARHHQNNPRHHHNEHQSNPCSPPSQTQSIFCSPTAINCPHHHNQPPLVTALATTRKPRILARQHRIRALKFKLGFFPSIFWVYRMLRICGRGFNNDKDCISGDQTLKRNMKITKVTSTTRRLTPICNDRD